MRSTVVIALGLLFSTSALAGPRPAHVRPASATHVQIVAPVPVVHVAAPVLRPEYVWVDGHYEGRRWVPGHWEMVRAGASLSTPLVHVELRR